LLVKYKKSCCGIKKLTVILSRILSRTCCELFNENNIILKSPEYTCLRTCW